MLFHFHCKKWLLPESAVTPINMVFMGELWNAELFNVLFDWMMQTLTGSRENAISLAGFRTLMVTFVAWLFWWFCFVHFDSCTGWHKTPNPPETVGQGKKELKCTTSFKHRCKWEESCFIIVYVLFSPVGLPSSSPTFLELSGREVALEHLCFHFYLLFFSSAVSAQDKATWILAGQTTSVWFPRNHPCVYNWPSARQSFVTHGFTFTLRNIKI